MKIGIMIRTIEEKQGIGLYTLYLLDKLFPLDKNNEYILFYKNKNYWGRYEKYPNVQQVYVPMPTKILWDQCAIPWLARKYKLDLLFNTKFTVPLLASCPTAMVMHGSEWYVYPKHYNFLDVQYVKMMMPLYLKKAKLIISVSDRAKHDMVKYANGDPRKFTTIYLGYNTRFRVISDADSLKSVREKYNLPAKFIVFIGNFYPGKNIDNLLRAFSLIANQIPHKLLLVGGKKWKYEKVLELIRTLDIKDRVVMTNWVDPEELPYFYNLADVFTFPSWYESCPAPPWEAMACGCPVITSQTGGTPEVVGNAAAYVDPGDPNNIADNLLRVLSDETFRESLIQEGFQQIKKFSWERCARETLEAFEQLHDQ